MNFIVMTVLLVAAWLAVTGSFTVPNSILGLVLALISLWLVREHLAPRRVPLRPVRVLLLALLFFYELLKSAWTVAILVLSPRMDPKPGIFAYPLRVESDFEIALLANLITLTPGTLSVDVSDDRRTLYVHAIDCSDPEDTKRGIAEGFERRIMEAFG
jgi:multicomponent Na+:H+ antiporter subunit E